MKQFFQFEQFNTSYRQETLAGFTTFLTMAYIMVVNPSILAVAGIPKDAQVTATILAAVIGCLMMAFWAKRPFAIAPYMGENAFIAFVVVKGMGYSWQVALGAVFWAGLVFILLTVLKVRSWLAESIPITLKASFAVGIGLFLAFIGLNETGLVVLVIFMMAFLDTIGTLIGLSMRADLLDANGNLPEIERPMLADAVATTLAPLLGTSTTGAYIESAAGIAAGGRTGFTSLVVAVLFGLSLFFAPLFTMVPGYAAGIALVVIGSLMIQSITRLDFDDFTELIPAFLTISLMIFTFNIGVGMTVGLFSYPLIKLCTGRAREVSGGMWVLAALSLTFFIFMPKG